MKLPRVVIGLALSAREQLGVVQKPTAPTSLTVEAWSSGYLNGALVIMGCITVANMRRGVLLHKLILIELLLAIWRSFWLFLPSPVYSWWLSVGGMLLDASWSLHNVIAWMKVKPFLSRRASQAFIGTLIFVQPYWILEIYANFTYLHGRNDVFLRTRPWEAICRDPWWVIASSILLWKIKSQYEMTLKEIATISPRFGIMMLAAILSIVFFVLDIISATNTINLGLPSGINPFWKVSSVFKCLMDCVILDDFKTAMDRLRAYKISHIGSFSQDTSSFQMQDNGNLGRTWEGIEANAQRRSAAINFGGGALIGINQPPDVHPSMRNTGRVYPSQAHVNTPSSPESDPSSLGFGTFSEVYYLDEIIPSPVESDAVKKPEPAHVD